MYDSALKPEQITALYQAVIRDPGKPPAVTTSTALMTKSGKACTFPNDAQGKALWNECQNLRGIPACPVLAGQWEVCFQNLLSHCKEQE